MIEIIGNIGKTKLLLSIQKSEKTISLVHNGIDSPKSGDFYLFDNLDKDSLLCFLTNKILDENFYIKNSYQYLCIYVNDPLETVKIRRMLLENSRYFENEFELEILFFHKDRLSE